MVREQQRSHNFESDRKSSNRTSILPTNARLCVCEVQLRIHRQFPEDPVRTDKAQLNVKSQIHHLLGDVRAVHSVQLRVHLLQEETVHHGGDSALDPEQVDAVQQQKR